MAKVPSGTVPVKVKAKTVYGGKTYKPGEIAHVDPVIARRMAERGRVVASDENRAVQEGGRPDPAEIKAKAEAEAKAEAGAKAEADAQKNAGSK